MTCQEGKTISSVLDVNRQEEQQIFKFNDMKFTITITLLVLVTITLSLNAYL